MKLIVIALILLGLASKAYCQKTKVIEGPVVLHSNIVDQWGGNDIAQDDHPIAGLDLDRIIDQDVCQFLAT